MYILSKDTLRSEVEKISNNKVTVLYDQNGAPSFMRVIPQMTISEVLNIPTDDTATAVTLLKSHPLFRAGDNTSLFVNVSDVNIINFLNQIHPAFWVYDQTANTDAFKGYANEIFIGQFLSDLNTPHSLPGTEICSYNYDGSNIYEDIQTIFVEKNSGNNNKWRPFSVWDLSLIKLLSYTNGTPILGSNVFLDYSIIKRVKDEHYVDNNDIVLDIIKAESYIKPVYQVSYGMLVVDADATEDKSDWIGKKIVGLTSNATAKIVSDSTFHDKHAFMLSDIKGKFLAPNRLGSTIGEEIYCLDNNTLTNLKVIFFYPLSVCTGYTPIDWSFSPSINTQKNSGILDLVVSLTSQPQLIDGIYLRKTPYDNATSYCYTPIIYNGNIERTLDVIQSYSDIADYVGNLYRQLRLKLLTPTDESHNNDLFNGLVITRCGIIDGYYAETVVDETSRDLKLDDYNALVKLNSITYDQTTNATDYLTSAVYLAMSGYFMHFDSSNIKMNKYIVGYDETVNDVTYDYYTRCNIRKSDSSNTDLHIFGNISYFHGNSIDTLSKVTFPSIWNFVVAPPKNFKSNFRLAYTGSVVEVDVTPSLI